MAGKATALVGMLSVGALAIVAGSEPPKDWPMWGGTADCNLVSSMKGLPTSWDIKTKKNIKWVAELGSQSYGNPVVANGTVLVGTNNESMKDPAVKGDKGILMAFRETDGQFLWQAVHDKLSAGRANDWPFQGVCSSPMVENGIAYYVSNRGEVVAVDIEGFRDKGENDGPFKDEKQTREIDADIIWKYDMMEELGVLQHNMANSSPVIFENLIYVSTSNGQDESHVNVPSPKSPAIIALDKTTGKLVWEDASPGEKILHGQWSSPAVGRVGDTVQVVVGQGDGYVRSYEAKTGKKLWEFDMNPKDSVWPKTRNEVISTPVIYEGIVYIANGQDPEHGEGVGHLYAIDPTKRGDITTRAASSGTTTRSGARSRPARSSTTSCSTRTSAASSTRSTSRAASRIWTHDMFAAIWGSPIVIDGKVYLGDEDGDVTVLAADVKMKVDRREQHGQLGLLDAGARQRRAVHRQPQRALRHLGDGGERRRRSEAVSGRDLMRRLLAGPSRRSVDAHALGPGAGAGRITGRSLDRSSAARRRSSARRTRSCRRR